MQKNIIIAVLTILVAVLLGILVYEYKTKPINNQEISSSTTTTTVTTKFPTSNSYPDKNGIKSLNDYPKENDSEVKTYYLDHLVTDSKIDLDSNFKKTSFISNNGIKYSLTCTSYYEDPNDIDNIYVNCGSINVEIDEYNTSFVYYPNNLGCGDASHILITNNYLINQESSGCGAGGPITIYDKDGNKVFKEEYSEYMYNDIGYAKIKNNVLYYLTYPNWYSDKLYFTSYDLSTKEKNLIETINERPAGGN